MYCGAAVLQFKKTTNYLRLAGRNVLPLTDSNMAKIGLTIHIIFVNIEIHFNYKWRYHENYSEHT